MRAAIPDLPTPHPLGYALPAVYQDDDFTMRFVAAFDHVVAPILMTLDNLDAYLDPALTPPDFLPWLSGWVGLDPDRNWSVPQQRRLIARAVDLWQWRGTRRGLLALVTAFAGVDPDAVEIRDSGGVDWSQAPVSPVPGSPSPTVRVRVTVDDPDEVDRDRLERLVATAVPAETEATVEVLRG